jgi:hypothetical protein
MCYNFDAEALRKVTMFFKNKNISKTAHVIFMFAILNAVVHNKSG